MGLPHGEPGGFPMGFPGLHTMSEAPRTLSVIEESAIDKRNAGCGAFIGDCLYIWGGEITCLD